MRPADLNSTQTRPRVRRPSCPWLARKSERENVAQSALPLHACRAQRESPLRLLCSVPLTPPPSNIRQMPALLELVGTHMPGRSPAHSPDFVVKGFYEQAFSRLDGRYCWSTCLTPMQAGSACSAWKSATGRWRAYWQVSGYGQSSLSSNGCSEPRNCAMPFARPKGGSGGRRQQKGKVSKCWRICDLTAYRKCARWRAGCKGFPLARGAAAEQDATTMMGWLVGQLAFIAIKPPAIPEHLPFCDLHS